MPSSLAEPAFRLMAGPALSPGTPEAPRLVSYSPVDGERVGVFPIARRFEVVEARRRLAETQSKLGALALGDRIASLRRLRRELSENGPELTRLVARETGKTCVEIQAAEILATLNALAWLERRAPNMLKSKTTRRFPSRQVRELRPHGVIGLISAWNYPVFLTLPVIAAAVAAGNTVLWKPSELAAASSAQIYELLRRSGLGEFVTLAQGGAETGSAVIEAACDKYVFIGGGETGRDVLSRLGALARPAVAELGGSDPCLVLADADLDLAAKAIVWARTLAAGQTCMAPRRIYVERAVYEPFLERLKSHLERLRVGDPLDETTDVGPLRTEALRDAALHAVDEAVRLGASLLCGGEAVPGPGYFMRPTLLANCDQRMDAFRGDLFAPLVTVCPVEDAAEAVRRGAAEGSALTASVWTRSRRTAAALTRSLPGSVISVNELLLPAGDGAVPFGGAGASGYGRVRGEAGLLEMVRTCVIDLGAPISSPRFHYAPYERGTLRLLESSSAAAGSGEWKRRLDILRAAIAIRKGITR